MGEVIETKWDTRENMVIYWTYRHEFRENLDTRKIVRSNKDMIMAMVTRIFESSYLTPEWLIDWEKKVETDKTMTNLKN